MDHLADLSLFLRVLDAGSISAAARRSGISPAVASQRLKRLERHVGARLFHRTTRKLEPTSEGRWLAEHGRGPIEAIESLAESLRQSASEVRGTLRITASASFGRLHLAPLLPRFLAQHPRLSLDIDFSDHLVDLVASGTDVAIRIGSLQSSSLIARRIATDRRVLCASPEYLRRRGTPRMPADLRAHDCLLLRDGPAPRATWRLSDGEGGQVSVRVQGRLESNLGDALRAAALAGMGIAQHSTWHVCEDLRAGRLVVVLPDHPPPDAAIQALTPQRRKPLRARAFIDFIAARFGTSPPWEHG